VHKGHFYVLYGYYSNDLFSREPYYICPRQLSVKQAILGKE